MTKTMGDFRNKASNILGVRIPPHGWKAIFDEMDREGKLDNKTIIAFMILVCEFLEALDELE